MIMFDSVFENDVNRYGTQPCPAQCLRHSRFENDVNRYGTQPAGIRRRQRNGFENDVNRYGTQPPEHRFSKCSLRMM